MLEQQFSDLIPYLAVGLFGSGSECLGYDDEISIDHDFEPGFCVFIPAEDIISRRDAFLLERAYARLPRSYQGFERSIMSPVGGNRHGIIRTGEYFLRTVGSADGDLDLQQWMTIPEQALLEATNGSVFFDHYGEVSDIRNRLKYYPEDVRLKRLAGYTLLMAQSGQYNYIRCIKHNETAAAQLAAVEFVKCAMSVFFLLNRTYQPYYKWSFRALRALLAAVPVIPESLEYLLSAGNTEAEVKKKTTLIDLISEEAITAFHRQNITTVHTSELEQHAYAINNFIKNPNIRNMHILSTV